MKAGAIYRGFRKFMENIYCKKLGLNFKKVNDSKFGPPHGLSPAYFSGTVA